MMKVRAIILGFLLLASSVVPSLALSVEDARHLLGRTGFAAPLGEIEALLPLDRADAVAQLLNEVRETPLTRPPATAREWYAPNLRELSPEARRDALREMRQQMRQQMRSLKAWWYGERVATPSPLSEQMTLFWANHFTSASRVVRHPVLMYRQNALLRRHALGNFGALLRDIGRDPAMGWRALCWVSRGSFCVTPRGWPRRLR